MKVFILTKKQFVLLALAAAAAILGLIATVRYYSDIETTLLHMSGRRLPIYAVETQEKSVALTFDCAWENSDTDILMSLLSEYNVPATFFTTGDWCERYPEDVKRIFNAGHAIENHSNKHPHVAKIEADRLKSDTLECEEIIQELTGEKSRLYRAPYGEYSDSMLKVLEDDLGYKVIQWDVDSRDWQGRSAQDMAETIIKNVKNGSILLFHNDTDNTPQALEIIIPALINQGYSFKKVSDIIYWEDYTLDHTGRQIANEKQS